MCIDPDVLCIAALTKQPKRRGTDVPRLGEPTEYGKADTEANHNHIKQVPNIRRVEDGTSIFPSTDLIIEERGEPEIQDILGTSNDVYVTLYKHSIIESHEDQEEKDLPSFEVFGHTQAGEGVGSSRVVVPWLLDAVDRKPVPENDVSVPYGGDYLLNDALAKELFGVGDGGDLEGVEAAEGSGWVFFLVLAFLNVEAGGET